MPPLVRPFGGQDRHQGSTLLGNRHEARQLGGGQWYSQKVFFLNIGGDFSVFGSFLFKVIYLTLFEVFSPNSVSTLWGSYGRSKDWCP